METGIKYEIIIDLFRKVIASLATINITTSNDEVKSITENYLSDIINQYKNYLLKKDLNLLEFKYSEKEIVDFCNDCYEKVDIFLFAEDLEYGYSELIKKILEGRLNK